MFFAVKTNIASAKKSLAHTAGLLDAVSPLATLARGYAIAKTPPPGSELVTDASVVEVGSKIEVTLQKGLLVCRVEKTGTNRFQNNTRLTEKK